MVVGVRQLGRTPTQRRSDRRRDAEQLIKEAAALRKGERRCSGTSRVLDEQGEVVRDEQGNALRKPCKNPPIKGGTVCVNHGGRAPQVKAKAQRRLLAMVEPSITRLEALIHQDEHMPTALGAIKEVLNRAGGIPLGPVGEARVGDRDMRPVINIGIAVGGIQAPPGAAQVGIQALPVIDTTVTTDE